MDSTFSHAAFAAALGGIRYPLLADFHPKGAVGKAFGLHLDDAGIDDRATVLIDADGIIRHKSSVTPAGRRDMDALLATARELDASFEGDLPDMDSAPGLPDGVTLYIRDRCMFSRWALYARENLKLQDALPVVNVSRDDDARHALQDKGGKAQAPALDLGDRVLYESDAIAAFLAEHAALP